MNTDTIKPQHPEVHLQNPFNAPCKVLRIQQLKAKIGLSRSSIYARMDQNSRHHDPLFPKPIHLGRKAVAWLEAEIDTWLQSRIDLRHGNAGSHDVLRHHHSPVISS